MVSSREKSKADDAPFKILGFSLPEGTVVGMQAWSFHRDPSVFPNPEYFDPERWFPSPRDTGTGSYAAEDERLNRCVNGFARPLCCDGSQRCSTHRPLHDRMMQHMLPFGAGTRICPGRHQAQIVFRITIAAIVLNFDLAADPAETNEQTMAPRDRFVSTVYSSLLSPCCRGVGNQWCDIAECRLASLEFRSCARLRGSAS